MAFCLMLVLNACECGPKLTRSKGLDGWLVNSVIIHEVVSRLGMGLCVEPSDAAYADLMSRSIWFFSCLHNPAAREIYISVDKEL